MNYRADKGQKDIEPNLSEGKMLMSHMVLQSISDRSGTGRCRCSDDCPKAPGHTVRSTYVDGQVYRRSFV